MRLLLDSHASATGSSIEPEQAASDDPLPLSPIRPTSVCFSAVNLWELAIKRAKGTLRFDDAAMLGAIAEQRFDELPIADAAWA